MKRKVVSLSLLALLLLLSGCGKKEFSMPTANMEPTIPVGSVVLADMNAYQSEAPKRLDIVVFHPPEEASTSLGPDQTKNVYCKRIIGLPKEKIEIKENGVYIDGEAIDLPDGLSYMKQGPRTEIELGESEYFLLGDNTSNSFDSRYWGPVDLNQILGKVTEIQPGEDGNG
jgi:signal peptidase I